MIQQSMTLLTLFFLLAFTACKTRAPESDSSLRSVIVQGAGTTFVIYHIDGKIVYKRNCADFNATANPSACAVAGQTSVASFEQKLQTGGLTSIQINDIKDALTSAALNHGETQNIKPYVVLIDSAIMSGSGSSAPNGTVSVPPPAGIDNPLARKEVLAAMNQIRSDFKMDLNSYVIPCLANDTPHWSDIVIHYYCQLGAPRQCFTPKARSYTKDLAGYTRAYDECTKENDFSWVVKNQPDMFRYIMYSVYTSGKVDTFNQNDQDKVINEFYGVTDPTNPSDCNKRPRRKNEKRAAGSHCIDPGATPSPNNPGNSNTFIPKAGYYLSPGNTQICPDQYLVPILSGGVLKQIQIGWCGTQLSETWDCNGLVCSKPTVSGDNVTFKSTTAYTFKNSSGNTGDFTWEANKSAGVAQVTSPTPGNAKLVILQNGYYEVSSNIGLCAQDQYIEAVVTGNIMTSVKLGFCGNNLSTTYTCNGADCQNDNDPNNKIIVAGSNQYQFINSGKINGIYTWISATTRKH